MNIVFNCSESSCLKLDVINPLILLLLITASLLFQGCGGDDEERPTINNYYSDCEDNASEPPIPTYVTIEKKHLSHLSYARVIEHEREGDFLTYSAEGEKVISGVTRDSGIYKVVFQLSDGKWIHVGTVEPTPVSPF